ncbi:hypothetical protein [Streptomyces albidoflavus]|uniref:hypothetical protein n=1 Tax=Streptomyces albidoflavus TaxID=1886 RepID=UPI0011410BE7|nr:hypothetical protein [Streptomyces albidoflavus]
MNEPSRRRSCALSRCLHCGQFRITPAVTGPAYGAQLPGQTANPVRTILMTAPAPRAVPAVAPEPAVAAAE